MVESWVRKINEDLKPYLAGMNLSGFQGIYIANLSNPWGVACVSEGKIIIHRGYCMEKVLRIQQGDIVAYSDLLNTLHHEYCHIDIDNRMPFLHGDLSNEEVFPKGQSKRFLREFCACANSHTSMSEECLKEQIKNGTKKINNISENRDKRTFCDIVVDLAYLTGSCHRKKCGFLHAMYNCINDEVISLLARQLYSVMCDIEAKFPLKSLDELEPISSTILKGWSYFQKVEGNEKSDC